MATVVSKVVEEPSKAEKERYTVDREKTCPLLLRVFCSMGRHHVATEFHRGGSPSGELQIYTWMDCSLKELTNLIREVNPEARRKGTFFDFAAVVPDSRLPVYRLRDLGSTCAGRRGADDDVSLYDKKFQIGDYIDVSIQAPNAGGPERGGMGDRWQGGRLQRPRPY